MTRTGLINKMIIVANQEVQSHGYTFSAEAAAQLRELVTSGVNRMTMAELQSDNKTTLAQNNMREFVRRLCEKHRRETNTRIVENRTFSRGRMSICPIWPIC